MTLLVTIWVVDAIASIPGPWLALIGTLFGGIGLKIIERWLNKNADVRADRQDYRAEIRELQERLDKVEEEVDEWRTKYYAQQEHILVLKSMMIGAGITPPDPK